MLQKCSCSARHKEQGPESRYRRTTPQEASNVPLVTPLSAGCRGKCAIVPPRTHISARVSDPWDSGKKLNEFKIEQKYFLPAISVLPLCSQSCFNPLPRGPRPGRPFPVCQVGNGYDKTRLCSPIRSKTTALPQCARHHSAQRGRTSQVKSSHLYLYSAFNNTNCKKALHNIKIGKLCQ